MKINKKFIANLRYDYKEDELSEKKISKNPFQQFEFWFADALKKDKNYANAMTLATADDKGKPSSRIVLMKGFDKNGFTFFTNYQSRKAKSLSENPFASLTFFWKEWSRQVHIEGKAKKVSGKESDEYFQSRPRESQIGAWASKQSEVIKNREWLEQQVEELSICFENKKIPRPPHWGGYILIPNKIEFWQGRKNRLHDRFLYTKQKNSHWKIQRLSP